MAALLTNRDGQRDFIVTNQTVYDRLRSGRHDVTTVRCVRRGEKVSTWGWVTRQEAKHSGAVMLWIQTRWTFVLLALAGTALMGYAYYWSRRRSWIKQAEKAFNEHLETMQTRNATAAHNLQDKLALLEEKKQQLERLRKAQQQTATAVDSDSTDTDTEGSVGEFVLAIYEALREPGDDDGDQDDDAEDGVMVAAAGNDKADRSGLSTKVGAHADERITVKAA